jgi:hypothetical protein
VRNSACSCRLETRLRSLEDTPNNLPQQLTSFIGRERELRDAKRLLDGLPI